MKITMKINEIDRFTLHHLTTEQNLRLQTLAQTTSTTQNTHT